MSDFLSVDLLDPFMSMALQLDAKEQSLVTHFVTQIGPIIIPIHTVTAETSWAKSWVQVAFTSPLLLAATCNHSSEHQDLLKGQQTTAETLQLRVKALQGLHRSLHDESSGTSGEAIGTILLLIANEVSVVATVGRTRDLPFEDNRLSVVLPKSLPYTPRLCTKPSSCREKKVRWMSLYRALQSGTAFTLTQRILRELTIS
jgi:hypothetical protein